MQSQLCPVGRELYTLTEESSFDEHISICEVCTKVLAEGAEKVRVAADRFLYESLISSVSDESNQSSNPPHPTIPGYEILGKLGHGGMGVVYHARSLKLRRECALKVISSRFFADDQSLHRFQTEAQAIARLQHPGVVQVFEVDEHDGMPFMVLEFCAGGSLDAKLAKNPLPAKEAAELVGTLANAVHAAHQAKVLHRDLKPANVLLTADGTPKVSDFGLARNLDEQGQTQTGAVMGSPPYMPPEQARGEVVGPEADVYALGAILYECLTGRPPFRAATPVETLKLVETQDPVQPRLLNPQVPRDLETICLKCLEKDPQRRYSSSGLIDDLSRFMRGEPIHARPVGFVPRATKWVRRNPAIATLSALSGLLFTTGFILVTVFWLIARSERDRAEKALARASRAIDESFFLVKGTPTLERNELRWFRRQLLNSAKQQYEAFVQELGGNPRTEAALVRLNANMAMANLALEDGTNAIEAARTAVSIGERLIAKSPTVENHLELGHALGSLGFCEKEPSYKRSAYERGIAILEDIVQDNRENEDAQKALARCYINFSVQGGLPPAEALNKAIKAVNLYASLANAESTSFVTRRNYAFSLAITSRLASHQDNQKFSLALDYCRQSIEQYQRLVKDYPQETVLVKELANAFNERYMIQVNAKKSIAERAESLKQACRILDEGIAKRIEDDFAQTLYDRMKWSHNLYLAYGNAGLNTEALHWAEQTRERCEDLTCIFPDNLDFRGFLGQAYFNVAELSNAIGKKNTILEQLQKARTTLGFCTKRTTAPHYLQNLRIILQTLSRALIKDDRSTDALHVQLEAIQVGQSLCKVQPEVPQHRKDLGELFRELGTMQAKQGRIDEAILTVGEAAILTHDMPQELYKAAVNLAEITQSLGKDVPHVQRDRCVLMTLDLLRAALRGGFDDWKMLEKENAFSPLQENAQFQRILREWRRRATVK